MAHLWTSSRAGRRSSLERGACNRRSVWELDLFARRNRLNHVAIAGQGLQNSGRMLGAPRFARDIQPCALAGKIKEQPFILALENIAAELAKPCCDLAEHPRPVRN